MDATNRAKILLVEDEAALAENTRLLLNLQGFEVVWASTIGSALIALESDDVDVILLDLRLGEEDGASLLDAALACGRKLPPVIVVSAEPDYEIAIAAKVLQAVALLRKPCGALRMKAAIQNALR
ncbi:MAG: response regulator [Rudaea sp.]